MRRADVVVVGAGILGLCAAYELGRRGRDVICLEQATVGHQRSGSKSDSRLFRLSHDDPFYVRLAARALRGWEELQAGSGRHLIEPASLLIFGEQIKNYVTATAAAGVAVEVLTEDELGERFPDFAFSGPGAFNGPGLYEESARILLSREVLTALTGTMSAELREHERVIRVRESADRVTVETTATAYECRAVVLCPGAWSSDLARLAGLPGAACLQPTLGQVAYLRPRSGLLANTPAFIELASRAQRRGAVPSYAWGVPTPTLGTYKIGLHMPRERADPSIVALDDDAREMAQLTGRAQMLLPRFDPRPVAAERCFQDSSPDEDFVVDRVGRIVIGAGTSGRGFKFGPVLGEVMADLAEGKEPLLSAERFSLRRPAFRT